MTRILSTPMPFVKISWFFILYLLLSWGEVGAQNVYDIQKARERDTYPLLNRGKTLQGYHLSSNIVESIPTSIDTVWLGYYRRTRPEKRSLSMGYTGTVVSPWHNKSFFERKKSFIPFLFNDGFDQMIYSPEYDLFYHTKAPYTKVLYHQHGNTQNREDEFDFTLALNPNKYIGVGADFNYGNSLGYFSGSRSKGVHYRIFSTVNVGRYEAWASFGNNYIKLTEHGGVQNDRFITHPEVFNKTSGSFKSTEVPMLFSGRVWNALSNGHFRLSHRYSLGSYNHRSAADSLTSFGEIRPIEDSLSLLPVASIGHILDFRKANRQYINLNTSSHALYSNHYSYIHNRKRQGLQDSLFFLPQDSLAMWQLSNTFQLSLREGFRPWVKFGIDAYARLENRLYHQPDTIGSGVKRHAFNTVLGGSITRKGGTKFNFDALGEITLLGEDVGSFLLKGGIQSRLQLLSIPVSMKVWGALHNQRPEYFLRHFHGSFHRWDRDFGYQKELRFGGHLSFDRWGVSLEGNSATLQNLIYFDEKALPQQKTLPLQVIAVRLRHQSQWGILGWRADALYQLTSDEKALPLPSLSARGELYLNFLVANVMHTQLGAECSVHTSYYMPYYEAATMQFINQRKQKYGNYPLINLFANFKLQRTRFFFEYYNLGELFLRNSSRFSLAHYPLLPSLFRMGICVEFFN